MIISFLRLNAVVEKQMYEMNILKLIKDFMMLQNILFVRDCLSENALAIGSFNDKFHPSKLPLISSAEPHYKIIIYLSTKSQQL